MSKKFKSLFYHQQGQPLSVREAKDDALVEYFHYLLEDGDETDRQNIFTYADQFGVAHWLQSNETKILKWMLPIINHIKALGICWEPNQRNNHC